MTVREYIGARYVPLFMGEWDGTKTYEPLSIVEYNGNSYTSRQYVPANIAITNETYWAVTGNYNAQIEQYRQEVQSVSAALPISNFDNVNTVKDYVDDVSAVLPISNFDNVNTVKKYIDDEVTDVTNYINDELLVLQNEYYINVDNPPEGFTALSKEDSTDNSTNLQAMLDACGYGHDYIGVVFGLGTYEFETGLTIANDNTKMIGQSNRQTRLMFKGTGTFFNVTASADVFVQTLGIYNTSDTNAHAFDCPTLMHFHFTHLQIHSFHIAFYINVASGSHGSSFWDDVKIADDYLSTTFNYATFYGFYCRGNVNALTMRDLVVSGRKYVSEDLNHHNAIIIDLEGGSDIWFINGSFPYTKNKAMKFKDIRGDIHIVSIIMDGCNGRAIDIDNCNDWGVVISDCWLNNSYDATVTNENLIYVKDSSGVSIANCNFGNTLGTTHNCINCDNSKVVISNCTADTVDNFLLAKSGAIVSVANCMFLRKRVTEPATTGKFLTASDATTIVLLIGNYCQSQNFYSGTTSIVYGIMNAYTAMTGTIVDSGNLLIT